MGFPSSNSSGDSANVNLFHRDFKKTRKIYTYYFIKFKFDEKLMPYLTALSKFRDDIRNEAKQTKRNYFI